MTYQTVDDAVTLIKRFGKGALLAKTDIEHGYKNIPIHPRDHELLGFAIGHDIYYDIAHGFKLYVVSFKFIALDCQ